MSTNLKFPSESVRYAQPSAYLYTQSHTASVLDEWKGKKQSTEHLIKLLHTYKDLGDAKDEVSDDVTDTGGEQPALMPDCCSGEFCQAKQHLLCTQH